MNSMENPVQIHGNPSEIHEIRRKFMPDPWIPWKIQSRSMEIHVTSMKSVENPRQIHGNPAEIPRKIHSKSMKSVENPDQMHRNSYGRKQNSYGLINVDPMEIYPRFMADSWIPWKNPVQIHGNPSEIHEMRRKSMRNLSAPLICTVWTHRFGRTVLDGARTP